VHERVSREQILGASQKPEDQKQWAQKVRA
jgi:hypothetical protein